MAVTANNLTRAQLFQILPRYMTQYELAFVRNSIIEADRDTKMIPSSSAIRSLACSSMVNLTLKPLPPMQKLQLQPSPWMSTSIVQHRAMATSASKPNLKVHPTPKLWKSRWKEERSDIWSTPLPAMCITSPMMRSSCNVSKPN
jgi:hypothetical protein